MSFKNTLQTAVASITFSAAAFSLGAVAASVPSSSSLSCPTANGTSYTSGSVVFSIECGFDRFDSDMSMVYAYSLNECMDACANKPTCVDVSYVPGNAGPCYLKSNVGKIIYNSGVWGARSNRKDPVSCSTDNGTTYTTSAGRTYTIECDLDHYDNDFMGNPTYVNDLEGCIAACDAQSGCVDVSLSGTACYLKRASGAPSRQAGLSGARCILGCSVASSSVTSSVASSPSTVASSVVVVTPATTSRSTQAASSFAAASSSASPISSSSVPSSVVAGTPVSTSRSTQAASSSAIVSSAAAASTSASKPATTSSAAASSAASSKAAMSSAAVSTISSSATKAVTTTTVTLKASSTSTEATTTTSTRKA